MARLPATGQMLCSPEGHSTQLDEVAGKLSFKFGVAIQFDELERQEIWEQLAYVCGLIEREEQRPDVDSVIVKILKLQAGCEHVLQLFTPFRGGFGRRDVAEFAAAVTVLERLAINPETGSRDAAHAVLERFMTTPNRSGKLVLLLAWKFRVCAASQGGSVLNGMMRSRLY